MKYIHATAEVSKKAIIGQKTYIWHQAQIRENVTIGNNCIIGKGVYIDKDVIIGNNVKIQNYASVYHGTLLEDNIFVGPYVCFSNDKYPRAVNVKGEIKKERDWELGKIIVKMGVSIGAGAIILPYVTLESYAMIGAGSVVTKNVARQVLVLGNPARERGFVCVCGRLIAQERKGMKKFICDMCY